MASKKNVKASPDVGNSSSKIIIVDGVVTKKRKQPTVISYLPKLPQFEDHEVDVLVANLHKNMIVNIASPSVERGGLVAVGEVSYTFGGAGFNIKTHKKAEKDLTLIQPLAMIAVNAVQNAYATDKKLADKIDVTLDYTSAIPVVDYSKVAVHALQNRLIGKHQVIVHVGEGLQVPVTINIQNAKIVQEGIPAFYAILNGDEDMFKNYNERYDLSITGQHFAEKKILFVDVGEGTLELVTVVDGMPVVMKSGGARLGVGHAGDKANAAFKHDNKLNADLSRSMFMAKVLDTRDKWHEEAKQALKEATYEQQEKIYDAIVNHIENVLLNDLDEIVVFGGGTNVFTDLEQQLVKYADEYKMRVLWITGEIASLLNAIGLDELNRKVFFPVKDGE